MLRFRYAALAAKKVCYLMMMLAIVAAPSASAHTTNEYAELAASDISGFGADQLSYCSDQTGYVDVPKPLEKSVSESQPAGFGSDDSCCQGVCTIAYLGADDRATDRALLARHDIGRFPNMNSADTSGFLQPPRL